MFGLNIHKEGAVFNQGEKEGERERERERTAGERNISPDTGKGPRGWRKENEWVSSPSRDT